MNLWQLGRLALERGDLDEAQEFAIQSLGTARVEGASRPEVLAAPLQLLGNVLAARGQYAEAIEDLEIAVATFERSGQALGSAWSLADLAIARAKAGDLDGARDAYAQARAAGRLLNHQKFQLVLGAAQEAVGAMENGGAEAEAESGSA
jgi:tetratricopeptide (TPR) repeat protein